MRVRSGSRKLSASAVAVLVLLGTVAVVLASFALAGFPYRGQEPTQLIWAEVIFLVLLLAIPLFR